MDYLSSKKQDIPKKPEVVIEYNNKSYESFIDNGFEAYIPRSVYGPRDRMLTWLNKVDLRKGPLERTVRSIVRLKAIDYNSPKHERKEFVYYEEDWTACDWLGIPIDPYGGHVEGRFSEALYSRKLDERSGEFIGNVYTGIRDRYYIPWSKKNVDEIIANSAHSTKESIKFIIKFGVEDGPDGFSMTTRNQFSYDQFVNWDWQRLKDWQYYPVDELFNRPKAFKAKATSLEFKPQ